MYLDPKSSNNYHSAIGIMKQVLEGNLSNTFN